MTLGRLVVTEEGRDPSAVHLEHSFVHQYTPRETCTQGSPGLKRTANPAAWKRNKRGLRHKGVEPSGALSFETCAAAECRCQCSEVSMEHRQHIQGLANSVWSKEGEKGIRELIAFFVDVKEPNMKTIAKHGNIILMCT